MAAERPYKSTPHTRKGATTTFGSRTDIGCLRDHNEADRQLYVCSNGDASHRQHHAPVAVLPPFRSQSVPDAASLPAHPAYRTRRKIPLDVAPFILHKGLRAPPVMA